MKFNCPPVTGTRPGENEFFRWRHDVGRLLVILLAPAVSESTEVSLDADRPSFADSPGTIPARGFQLEGGVAYVKSEPGVETVTVGKLNARFGWREDLEFRIVWDGYEDNARDGQGYADPDVQLKWRFTADNPLGFRAAVLGSLSLPLGDSGSVAPEARLIWDYGRPSGAQPYGTLDLSYPEENGERLFVFEPSIGISYSIGRMELFASYFGTFKDSSGPAHSADFGITRLVDERLQIDLEFTAGINDRADDLGISVGFVKRW